MLRSVPSGVPACRLLVKALVAEVGAFYGGAFPAKRTYFMGFSQGFLCRDYSVCSLSFFSHLSHLRFPPSIIPLSGGAMLALDSALGMDSAVGGVVLVSGFLMDVDVWGQRLASTHRNLRVLQLHGTGPL